MRLLKALSVAAALTSAACAGNGSSMPTSPTATATMTGVWAGTASDSTGSMMGAGLTASMIGNMSGTITQNGNTFSGGTNSCSGMFDHGHLSMHR